MMLIGISLARMIISREITLCDTVLLHVKHLRNAVVFVLLWRGGDMKSYIVSLAGKQIQMQIKQGEERVGVKDQAVNLPADVLAKAKSHVKSALEIELGIY